MSHNEEQKKKAIPHDEETNPKDEITHRAMQVRRNLALRRKNAQGTVYFHNRIKTQPYPMI